MINFIRILSLLSYASISEAYIGPGLSAGTAGIVFGIILSVLLGLFAFFWYPIKRLFKKIKRSENSTDDS